MQYYLSEYEIELLKSGYRNGNAWTITLGIPSMAAKLKSLGLIEQLGGPDLFVLAARGCAEVMAQCEWCKGNENVLVKPTGSRAKLTFICQACIDRWTREYPRIHAEQSARYGYGR